MCAVFFFCLFISLGTWQVQRLLHKQALIARVDARIHAPPEAAPAPTSPATPFNADAAEYKPVALRGEFDHRKQALVQASTALGAGFWVLTPLRTEAGWWVWVNRGFVPPPSQRGQQAIDAPSGPQEVQGLLRLTEPKGGFLRNNDAAANRWYSRDVAALSTAHQLPAGQVAPYFVDAQAKPTAKPGQWPVGGLTVVKFSNNHLAYIFTWYALALMVAAAFAYIWRHETSPQATANAPGTELD